MNAASGMAIGVALAAAAFVIVTRPTNQRFSPRITILARVIFAIVVTAFMGGTLFLFGQFVGYRSPLFAVIAAADALGVVALTRPAFHWGLPAFLRSAREWERTGRLYRLLGVPQFGALLRRPPLRYLNTMVYVRGHGAELAQVRSSILDAEGAHFWAVMLTIPLIGYDLSRGWWDSVLGVLAFHIALNAYPTFHLRSVRIRIERLCAAHPSAQARRSKAART
jgi:hypothetical protein